jgi:hypothetical protein
MKIIHRAHRAVSRAQKVRVTMIRTRRPIMKASTQVAVETVGDAQKAIETVEDTQGAAGNDVGELSHYEDAGALQELDQSMDHSLNLSSRFPETNIPDSSPVTPTASGIEFLQRAARITRNNLN